MFVLILPPISFILASWEPIPLWMNYAMPAKEMAQELQPYVKDSGDLLDPLLHGVLRDANGWLSSIGFLRLSPVEIPIPCDCQPT
jgi:hypothetical protein